MRIFRLEVYVYSSLLLVPFFSIWPLRAYGEIRRAGIRMPRRLKLKVMLFPRAVSVYARLGLDEVFEEILPDSNLVARNTIDFPQGTGIDSSCVNLETDIRRHEIRHVRLVPFKSEPGLMQACNGLGCLKTEMPCNGYLVLLLL